MFLNVQVKIQLSFATIYGELKCVLMDQIVYCVLAGNFSRECTNSSLYHCETVAPRTTAVVGNWTKANIVTFCKYCNQIIPFLFCICLELLFLCHVLMCVDRQRSAQLAVEGRKQCKQLADACCSFACC